MTFIFRPKLLPVATFFQLNGLQRSCEMTLSTNLNLDNAVSIYQMAKVDKFILIWFNVFETKYQFLFARLQHHGAAELFRFCKGFFLQFMDQLLDREDFHRLLLGGVGQELLRPELDTWDEDGPNLLRDLEAALIQRLYTLHTACQE